MELTKEQIEENARLKKKSEHEAEVAKLIPAHSVVRMNKADLLVQYEKAVLPYLEAMLRISDDNSITLETDDIKVLFSVKTKEETSEWNT